MALSRQERQLKMQSKRERQIQRQVEEDIIITKECNSPSKQEQTTSQDSYYTEIKHWISKLKSFSPRKYETHHNIAKLWLCYQSHCYGPLSSDIMHIIMQYFNNLDIKPHENCSYLQRIYVSVNKGPHFPYIVLKCKSVKKTIVEILRANNIKNEEVGWYSYTYDQYQLWHWKSVTYDKFKGSSTWFTAPRRFSITTLSTQEEIYDSHAIRFEKFCPIRKSRRIEQKVNANGHYWISIKRPPKPNTGAWIRFGYDYKGHLLEGHHYDGLKYRMITKEKWKALN